MNYEFFFHYLSFRTERNAVKNLVDIHVYAIEILRRFAPLDDK